MSETNPNVKPSILETLETTKRLQVWIKNEIDRANDQLEKINKDIEVEENQRKHRKFGNRKTI